MAANKKLLILPGDGIGPEVMGEVRRIIGWFEKARGLSFDIAEDLVGGAAIDAYGTPLADKTLDLAMGADAVLLGAVGGPKWEPLPFEIRPERGLLKLRKEMQLYANLRPAIVFDELADASTLKREVVAGLDILIIRELTGDLYFGTPRGVETLPDGTRRGINTMVYTSPEVRRVTKIAFDLARKRGSKVCSVDKANVVETTEMWREEVIKLHGEGYEDIQLSHMYVDNAAMQLVRNPKQFDVIVTGNIFGDILSDEAAMLTGSLGMLPSASLGDPDETGRRRALYEPVHGSAPDIAGQGIANPLATVLSFAMMLRYSFDLDEAANQVEQSVRNVLARGLRTGDIMQPGMTRVSTQAMGEAIVEELAKLG
ncbi:3-isopropylmalate dehydrogenase [Tistrella mobilis]|uniref:3-isopropylmalate dehydrogenase n=1 Tax=Tistrella mobilis (strain KA081020-065) TaxID=1110502 RepID=I3TQQ4_TISMK|nr:3-isopropylmalate dehydrogenase [Tistrella mobilis]AFK55092.1 Isocitrate/isopropylmalate dehydrogenase [Tistrella mobilis KA081020-065]